jgi:hypothetical protein
MSGSVKSLIVLGCFLFIYFIIIIIIYIVVSPNTSNGASEPPIFTPNTSSSSSSSLPPIFTPSATSNATTNPTNSPTPISMPSPEPHLLFDNSILDNVPNYYHLGCQAALSEGIFPFSNFNTTGKYNNGVLCDYYSYDTWGFGGDTDQLNCTGTCIGGVKSTCSSTMTPPSPNKQWTDAQCDICATASKDPNCIWTRATDSCYKTVARVDYVNGQLVDNNVTYVPRYHSMDISQCYYRSQGNNNDHKLCCDPSVG